MSSALQFHAQNVDDSSTITISWFIRFISKWFKIISTRTPKLTLGKSSKTLNFLEEVVLMMQEIKVGNSRSWKSFQTEIIISTISIIKLSKYLLDNEREREGFEFVLTLRFMQDCLENYFLFVLSM